MLDGLQSSAHTHTHSTRKLIEQISLKFKLNMKNLNLNDQNSKGYLKVYISTF